MRLRFVVCALTDVVVVWFRLVWIGSGLVAGSWPLGWCVPFNFNDSDVEKSFLGTSVRLDGVSQLGLGCFGPSEVLEGFLAGKPLPGRDRFSLVLPFSSA